MARALLASLAVHLSALAVGGGFLSSGLDRSEPVRPPPKQSPIRLGIAKSTIETITWLGFTIPTPQEAVLSEVEQAAFDLASAAGSPSRALQTPSPAPMGQIEPHAAQTSQSQRASSLVAPQEAPASVPAFEAEFGPPQPPPLQEAFAIELPEGRPSEAEASQADAQQSDGENKPGESSQTKGVGVPSDKQSPATSLTKPLRVRPGQPASAQGLEIKTRVPPEVTIPTSLLSGGRRAVYAVSFAKHGKVKTAKIERSSGSDNVDQTGLNAIYNWTATGEALEKLVGDGVVTVYIEIIAPR